MAISNRRSSIINIESWLDECPCEEPDSVIYEDNYYRETAEIKTRQIEPDIVNIYEIGTKICAEIGLPKSLIDSRLNDIDVCITEYLKTIEATFQEELDYLCKYKDNLLREVQKLTKDLYLPNYVPDDNITLLQHCKRLKSKCDQLNAIGQARKTRLQELRDKQTRHCLILGIKTPHLKFQTDIPTEDELKELAATVLELQKEEARRKAKFSKLKTDIKRCIEILEYKPEGEFETNLLSGEPNYSESYMLQMTQFSARLEAQIAVLQQKLNDLTTRLKSLYERMETPQEAQDEFFSTHATCNPTLILEVEDEVERYEELRKKNIGLFIGKIKEELKKRLTECYYSEEEQNILSLLETQEHTEDLLALCERELERLRKFYQDNKEILDKINEWERLFKEWSDNELKQPSPSRLKNRGGALLMEEKRLKALKKNLPRVEKEIISLAEKFEQKTGNKFKVRGTSLDEFVALKWRELNRGKEGPRPNMTTDTSNGSRKPFSQTQAIVKRTPAKRGAAGAGITPTPSKLQCHRLIISTPTSSLHRTNQQLGLSNSVKKSAQKSIYSSYNNLASRGPKFPDSRSKLPVPCGSSHANAYTGSGYSNVSQRNKRTVNTASTNSNGSMTSALSMSEQEFEDIIVTCPASAKK